MDHLIFKTEEFEFPFANNPSLIIDRERKISRINYILLHLPMYSSIRRIQSVCHYHSVVSVEQ